MQGLFVVDLTSDVGGAYAGKLLCDLGARVVMVEPPGGSPLRTRAPLFAHLSGGKESATGSDDLVAGLAREADVLLTDGTSPYEPALRSPLREDLVRVDLSPFGRSGQYAAWRGSDIAVWALGGYMYFTGEAGREPLAVPGSQAEFHAGVHAAFAALAALHDRNRTGLGQQVEISSLEAALAAHVWLVTTWVATGKPIERTTHDLVRCADGWVYLTRIAPNPDLFVLMDRADLLEDLPAQERWGPAVFDMFAEWAKDRTKAEIVELGQELRVAVTPVMDAADIAADPQMAARDWWETSEDGRFPGPPYKLAVTPSRRRGRAPRVGEHTAAVREAATAAMPPRRTLAVISEPPLRGVRVVEVTQNWAGPILGRHLADLGADVVKVEAPQRPATRALVWPGPVPDFQLSHYNRALYFHELNRNKRDVVIDLSSGSGKEVFLELVRTADVLVENNSARVMPNLGLDYPVLREVHPALVMVSMAGYGATGPSRNWVAYGSNIESTSGLASVTGYPDGQMYRTGLFYADPVSGIQGAVAVLAALEHRRRTGEGQWIEMSLNEAGAGFFAELLVDYHATGTVRGPNGNRDPRFAPQGAYRCAGVDDWVAICVQSDADWSALVDVMGRADLAGLNSEERRTRHDEIDEAISAWTAMHEQYEVAWDLQRRGVSAAPVLANWQILPDPHIHSRGFYVGIEHPVVGVYPHSSWPWRFSRTPARVTRPAPVFAEHNREVLAELGLSEERIEKLYAEGVTADAPAYRLG